MTIYPLVILNQSLVTDTSVDLHEYIFHFTKIGNVKLDKLQIGVTYQDKTNIGRWKTATEDRRDRSNVWFIPYPTIEEARAHPAVFPIKLPVPLYTIARYSRTNEYACMNCFMGIGGSRLSLSVHLKVKLSRNQGSIHNITDT